MGAAVQFVGRAAVLKAFEKYDCLKWSLANGVSRNLITAYEGDDDTESRTELEDWLTMIRGNTTGMFTLRFYEKGTRTIRPETKEIRSFIFRLAEDLPYQVPQLAGMGGVDAIDRLFTKLSDRMDQMDKKIDAKIGEIEKKDDPEKLETWEKLLDHPVVMAGVGKLFNIDVQGILSESAKLSGIPQEQTDVETSVNIMRRTCPDIDIHLAKLARLSEKNPQLFKALIGQLNTIAV